MSLFQRKRKDSGQEPPAVPNRRRRRWLLVLLLLVVAILAWWRISQPATMRLAGRYQLTPYTSTLYPSLFAHGDAYFLFEQSKDLTCFNWDGTVRWRVEIPRPSQPPEKNSDSQDYAKRQRYSLSPDNHYLAALVFQGKEQRFLLWRDGKACADYLLPTTNLTSRIQALDSGQVYCWFKRKSDIAAFLLDAKRIIARGKLAPAAFESFFSPDGALCKNDFRLSCQATPDGRFLLTQRFKTYRLPLSPKIRSALNMSDTSWEYHSPKIIGLAVYQQPGRLAAFLPIIPDEDVMRPKMHDPRDGKLCDIFETIISPDGHTIVIRLIDHETNSTLKISKSDLLRYTW